MKNNIILHCIPTMLGGGAERQLAYLCKPLRELGWEVHVALLKSGVNIDRLRHNGAILHFIDHSRLFDPLVIPRLNNLISKIKPAIIQTWLPHMDILGGAAALYSAIPWILCERNARHVHVTYLQYRLRLLLAKKAQAIIANSGSGADYWKKHGARSTKVIPNIVPIQEIDAASPVPRDSVTSPENKIVLYCGRFSAEKNITNLILALKIVLENSTATAICIGDGPLRQEAEQTVNSYGLSQRLSFMGYVENPWSFMKIADVFVLVSFFEGMPNAVMEALTCGCPLVVSDIPSHREILNDQVASFVNPIRPAEIANTILRVLSKPLDSEHIMDHSRILLSKYSEIAIAKMYDSVYKEILSSF